MESMKQFYKTLRTIGFKRSFTYRGSPVKTVGYTKSYEYNGRKIDMIVFFVVSGEFLSETGRSDVAFFIDGVMDERGVRFCDHSTMLHAIESVRAHINNRIDGFLPASCF